MIKLFFTVLFVSVFAMVSLVGVRVYKFAVSTSPATETDVTVPSGSSLRQVTETLATNKVITDAYLFELWARLRGDANRIRAGRYHFAPSQSPDQVLQTLVKGQLPELSLTVPEGWTLAQIESLLLEKLGAEKLGGDIKNLDALLHNPQWLARHGIDSTSAEGYLFPETYAYDESMTGEKIVEMMIDTFHRRIDPLWKNVTSPTLPTLREVITLASIVEREAKRPEERPLIAGVYLNRLRLGMPLQADPTTIYGIPNFNGNLTRDDLKANQPYNTYVKTGLTPTPICNPGLASIKAVLAPAATDALYFVARGDGSHEFSKTLTEQNQAVEKYQIAPAQQSGAVTAPVPAASVPAAAPAVSVTPPAAPTPVPAMPLPSSPPATPTEVPPPQQPLAPIAAPPPASTPPTPHQVTSDKDIHTED